MRCRPGGLFFPKVTPDTGSPLPTSGHPTRVLPGRQLDDRSPGGPIPIYPVFSLVSTDTILVVPGTEGPDTSSLRDRQVLDLFLTVLQEDLRPGTAEGMERTHVCVRTCTCTRVCPSGPWVKRLSTSTVFRSEGHKGGGDYEQEDPNKSGYFHPIFT